MSTPIVIIDPGHEGSTKGLDPGAVGNGLKEADVVLDIAKRVRKALQGYNVTVFLTRESSIKQSLWEKTRFANSKKANFFFSIHINSASSSTATGYEDFMYNATKNKNTKIIQEIIHSKVRPVLEKYGIRNRGMKTANFHVLRETTMPALLTEVLFINNPKDATLLKNPTFLEDIAIAFAGGIAQALGLTRIRSVQKEVDKEMLNDTGRKACREIIEHACNTGLFDKDHHFKVGPDGRRRLDTYSDRELVSYSLTYVNRTK